MLLRFRVSNHLSIRDMQELSLIATSLRDEERGLIERSAITQGRILPADVIYGANASGKSNIVDAISFMRKMVVLSHSHGRPDGGVPRKSFELDHNSSENPTYCDMDFIVEDVRYHYGFEATDSAFESEWLYSYPRKRKRMLFERTESSFQFGRDLKGNNKNIAELTRKNSLFLSAAAQNRHPHLSNIYRFFEMVRVIRDTSISGILISKKLLDESENGLDQRVIDYLGTIDTGVVDFRRKKFEIPEGFEILQREVVKLLEKFSGEPLGSDIASEINPDQIELGHRGTDGDTFFLELNSESAGTRRLLIVLSHMFFALDSGGLLCIDELDASLHTNAVETLLKVFCSSDVNSRGAQLIATTHDTNLMNPVILRRDQQWFTEKDQSGATQLYSLSDFRTRKDDNFERDYREGRYGAIPCDNPTHYYELQEK